jgi:hypothetical protein
MLDGRFTLRLAALAFRTHRRTIDLAVRVLREQAAAVGTGQHLPHPASLSKTGRPT